MKNTVLLTLWLSAVFSMRGGVFAFEAPVLLQPAYIEQTNGMFAVCAFDGGAKAKLLLYKGVFISKSQLPSVSIMRGNLIFASGERPQAVTHSPDMWKPRPEDSFIYGKVPYPVEEVDPPLELCKTEQFEVVVGFRLRGRFFAVEKIGKMAEIKDLTVPVHDAKWRFQVLLVRPPQHREHEVRDFIRKLKAKI